MLNIDEKTEISTSEEDIILRLWNSEFPVKSMLSDFRDFELNFVDTFDWHHYFIYKDDKIIGWGFKFLRYSGTWFVMVIDRIFQRQGYGKILLNNMLQQENEVNCWVIDYENYERTDGSCYPPPIKFLMANGFSPLKDIRGFNGKVSALKFVLKREII